MNYKTNDDMLICELAKTGMKAYVIASKFEITTASVYDIVSKNGGYVEAKKGRTKAIRKLILQGLTTDEIMNKVDACRIMINQVRYKMGSAKPRNRPETSMAERYKMVVSLVSDGMTVTEACRNVRLSSRDYVKMKALA
jgi:hypothetical protein